MGMAQFKHTSMAPLAQGAQAASSRGSSEVDLARSPQLGPHMGMAQFPLSAPEHDVAVSLLSGETVVVTGLPANATAAELRSGLSAQKPLPKNQTYKLLDGERVVLDEERLDMAASLSATVEVKLSLRFSESGFRFSGSGEDFCSFTLSPATSETVYGWKDVPQQSMTGDALFAKLKSGHFGAAFGKSGHFGAALANASAEDCAKLENFLSGVEQLQWMEKRGASGTHGCWMVCVCTSVIDGHRLCGEFGQGNDCC